MGVNDNIQHNPPESMLRGVVENNCEYSIRIDSVNGELARYTQVGQPVVHRWNCEDSEF